MKLTAAHLKCDLMWYFRFKRQWVCADEVQNRDILVDCKKFFMEVEVKISKSDLVIGEAKKQKHERMWDNRFEANRFALCVPESMYLFAEEWILKTNPKYGLFVRLDNGDIWVRRTAKNLHDNYNLDFKEYLLKRLSSSIILKMRRMIYPV